MAPKSKRCLGHSGALRSVPGAYHHAGPFHAEVRPEGKMGALHNSACGQEAGSSAVRNRVTFTCCKKKSPGLNWKQHRISCNICLTLQDIKICNRLQ